MKKVKTLAIFFGILFVFLFLNSSVYGAYFRFDPSTVNTSAGSNFEVKIFLDPGTDKIYSTDIYINYDPSLIKAINVKSENLFPTVSNDISVNGRVYIAGMVNDPTQFVDKSGNVATITFQALKEGSGNLFFDCNNSKIVKNDVNGTNVLSCNQNNTASITIGAGGSLSSTTNNQSSNNSNTDSLPQTLPQTGILDNVIKFGIPGVILLLLGGFLRMVF